MPLSGLIADVGYSITEGMLLSCRCFPLAIFMFFSLQKVCDMRSSLPSCLCYYWMLGEDLVGSSHSRYLICN